ncbi:MAG: cupin domain-containing protein [Myxococcota bacterium]
MQRLIDTWNLQPHPEGGYFRETYRAAATLPGTQRAVCTAIYYLLPAGERSRLHRIDADELWHFYGGAPLEIIELQPDGSARVTTLSPTAPQHLVPAGTWFGARPAQGSAWSLVGCTVSPGFEFSRFELGAREALLARFPAAAELIRALT